MEKKDVYRFWAVFHEAEDGISVSFPDLPGALTCGDTHKEAYRMAQEALELHLYGMERDGEEIPLPSDIGTLPKLESNEAWIEIRANMTRVRSAIRNKSVTKNVTMPRWLEEEATFQGINFSQVLQDALKEQLGLNSK